MQQDAAVLVKVVIRVARFSKGTNVALAWTHLFERKSPQPMTALCALLYGQATFDFDAVEASIMFGCQ